MQDKLKLHKGETLVQEEHRSKGALAEIDVYTYSIINADGKKVGSVIHTDHTSLNGFRRTQSVVQRDASGTVVVDETW